MKEGRVEDAIADLDKAIAIDPDSAAAYFSRGNAYYVTGRIDQAISDYDKAIALNPRYTNAYFVQKQYQKAFDDYNKAIKLDPEDATARRLRRDAYVRIELLSMPEDIFSKPMIKVVPTHFEDKQITNAK